MDYEISKINGQMYSLKDVARVIDQKQQKLYIKHDVYPIDMYTSIDEDTNNIILAVVFLKEETTEVYKKWCNHELT